MSGVPSDLFPEILLRLPAESLLRFRAVCKDWRSTIDHPSSIKSHTLHMQHSNTCTNLLIMDSTLSSLYFLSLHSIIIKTLVRGGGGPVLQPPVLPAASRHGLIHISPYDIRKSWVAWNPLTRERHALSDPNFYTGFPFAGVGLGYDYKVERIDEWYCRGKISLIYSLKSRSSKMMMEDFLWSRARTGAYLNGALHWISENQIIVFDLGSEEYRLVPLPPLGKPVCMYIDALDRCLFFSCCYTRMNDCGVEGWMMEDMTMMMWIKCFSFREQASCVAAIKYRRHVAFLKSKGQVFLQNDCHFFWLDVYKNSMKKVTIHGLPRCFACQNFRGSLVRLIDDDGVGGSTAGVNRKKNKKKKKRAQINKVKTFRNR